MPKIFIKTQKKKININTRGLGEVVLDGIIDTESLNKMFKLLEGKNLSDRNFAQKILYFQTIEPKLTFDEFKELGKEDLMELGNAFLKERDDISKHFIDSDNFFKDFRASVRKLKKEMIEDFRFPIAKIVLGGATTYMEEIKKKQQILLNRLVASRPIQDNIKRTLIGTHKNVFEIFAEKQLEAFRKYQELTDSVIYILKKYKWLFGPSLDFRLMHEILRVDQKGGKQDKAINKIFIDYCSYGNYQALELMLNGWETKSPKHFKKGRIKILRDCINVMQQTTGKEINVANAILPTLIVQIEGIFQDYLTLNNINMNEKSYDGGKEDFKEILSKKQLSKIDENSCDFFLDILFQTAKTGEPLKEPFYFNRHKIIHGENINYGHKDYLIRAFLVLDFLSILS